MQLFIAASQKSEKKAHVMKHFSFPPRNLAYQWKNKFKSNA